MRRIRGSSRGSSQSLERRDFGRHAGEKGDHVRGGQYSFGSRRSLQPGSAETEGRLQFDEPFSRRDSPACEFRRSYLVPERHGVNLEANNGIKLGGVRSNPAVKSKEKDFQSVNSVSVSVDHRILVQKSMFLDDGNYHSLYGLPSERYPLEDINLRRPTGDPMRSDIRYDDFGGTLVHLNKIPLREPYEVEGQKKPKLYSRDGPYLPGSNFNSSWEFFLWAFQRRIWSITILLKDPLLILLHGTIHCMGNRVRSSVILICIP